MGKEYRAQMEADNIVLGLPVQDVGQLITFPPEQNAININQGQERVKEKAPSPKSSSLETDWQDHP